MEIKVLDLSIDSEDNVNRMNEEDLFCYWDGWNDYIDSLNENNLDGVKFNYREIDKRVFILDDGGELIRLKNGEYLNVCWRGDCCRVWLEDDEDRIKYFDEKLN